VDLVDEQHLVCREIGDDADEVARFSIAGPEVARTGTPISLPMTYASVVLPSPGGPCSST
jgi:hypothetical protein